MGKGALDKSKDFLHKDKDYTNWKEGHVGADGDTHMDDSGGTKRSREEAGLPPDPTVEPDGSGDGVMVAARAGPSGGMAPSKETPITIPPNLNYGLPETHTCILPWTGWVTAAGLDKITPLQLKIRMNSPYDMLDMTTAADVADGAYFGSKAFYQRPIDPEGRQSIRAQAGNYPVQAGNNTTTAHERPMWREYFAKLYDYYTVLGCEYEIILYNPVQLKNIRLNTIPGKTISSVAYPAEYMYTDAGWFNTDVIVATQFDTYSATATTTGNVMPLANYEEVRGYKNIRWTPVPGGKKAIIRGTYKPGDAKRNIVNDGDVKTWTPTGSKPPTLTEMLTLNFWADPFHNARKPDTYGNAGDVAPSATGAAVTGGVNMEINLKYIVQFKDLKLHARYPNTVTADQEIIQTLNNTISAPGSALQSWTTAST